MKLANKLTRLHVNHPKTYEFLNFIFDILIKPIPIAVWVYCSNNVNPVHENAIQAVLYTSAAVLGSYLGGIMFYLIYQGTVQIIKLFVCTYKRLVIHVRVFDIWIKLFQGMIREKGTPQDIAYLSDHQKILLERYNKRETGKQRAYARQEERDIQNLEYAKQNFEREQRDAEYYRDRAEDGYESARKGDGIFTTADEKRKQAGKDLDNSLWHSQMAEEERRRIERLERKLGK